MVAPAHSDPVPATDGAAADPLAGTKYRVVRELAHGGSCVVYEAQHLDLRRRFAVKLLVPETPKRRLKLDIALERMRVEAQALGQLLSRHIVEVCDFGHTRDGTPFLVMPLLVGRTLVDELNGRLPRCLPPDEAVDAVKQLLAGLAVAHRAGLIHRDVKLANLFLCDEEDGRRVLKILDFGIVKVLPTATCVEPPAISTGDGEVVGTPKCMSPEQAMKREIGPATDIYGAGMVLYELLAGRAAFEGARGWRSLLRAIVAEDPAPLSAVAPQPIEPALEDVVMRALAKRPADRYASAEELSRALDHALELGRAANRSRGPPAEPGLNAPAPFPRAQSTAAPAVRDAAALRGARPSIALALVLASAAVSALAAAAILRAL